MTKKQIIFYIIGTILFSYGLGLIFRDKWLLGSTTLALGVIQCIYETRGKLAGQIIGLAETIFSIIVCALSSLYGSILFSFIVYVPIGIFGIVNWKKHDNNGVVDLKVMNWKKSLLTILLISVSTLVVSWILSLIPTQNLSILDSLSNILSIAGSLLVALRYKEGWIMWLLACFVDLAIWIILLVNGYSANAVMMIITSVVYAILNIWGFVAFLKLAKSQQEKDTSVTYHDKNAL